MSMIDSKTGMGKPCTDRRSTAGWASILLLLLATTAGAGELRLHALDQEAGAGSFHFQVANAGTQRLDGLRFHLPAGYRVSCPGSTQLGRALTAGTANLQAGERVNCVATPPMSAIPGSGAFAVSARDATGEAQVQNISASTRGVTTPDQGFVVLIAGAVHDDSSGDGLLDAGERIDYHYTVINLGTLDLGDLVVSDLAGPVTCPQTTLAVAEDMVCTRDYLITGTDAVAGEVINEIEVIGTDSLDQPVQGGDIVVRLNLQGRAGISIFKSPLLLNDGDGNGFASVGDTLLYTFVTKNNNAENLDAVDLVEPNPDLIDGPIECPATSLSGAPFSGLGTGALASMDTVLCSAPYTIQASDGDAGQVVNLVEARAQALIGGPILGTAASLVLLPGEAALLVSKSVAPASTEPGQTVVYTVTVGNAGNLPVNDVQVIDPLPAGVASFAWTCAGAFCPNADGTGAIDEMIPTLPIGAQLVYTVQAVLTDTPPNPVLNLVTVSPDGIAVCSPDSSPPPCQADAEVEVVGPPPAPRIPVPVNGPWSLTLMLLAMWLAVAWRLRL